MYLLKQLKEKLAQNNTSWLQRAFKTIRNAVFFTKLLKEKTNFKKSLLFLWCLHKERSLFSPDYYLNNNKDVDPKKVSPLIHFLVLGWKERRNPNINFNIDYYLSTYADIAQQGVNPFLHYIEKGWREGRNPSYSFSTNNYIANHPSCLAENTNPLLHRSRQPVDVTNSPDLREQILFDVEPKKFTKTVTVIIPIYIANLNGVEVLLRLLETIHDAYLRVDRHLSFILIDDGSPLKKSKELIKETGFLERQDTTYIENSTNQGFVKTVNVGLNRVNGDSDVILLNSDTEIHGRVFEILQHACYRSPNIASVTPLSNRATIASLTNWPFGEDVIYDLSAAVVAGVVESAGLIGGQNHTPTGHGFCMYLSRSAINAVGAFDDVTFLHGYGEENDWSMRAVVAGYVHTICTECFVFHHESMSFSSEMKKTLQKENSAKLLAKHPYYNEMVRVHLNTNHLDRYRKILSLLLLEKKKKKHSLKTICFVIHDSFRNHRGGVQQHVRQLVEGLICIENGYEVFIVSPDKLCGTSYEVHFSQRNESIEISGIDKHTTIEVLQRLEERIDILHIHHTFCLETEITDWLKSSNIDKKVLTIHDYDLFCSNPFLLNAHGEFCLAPDKSRYCHDKICEQKGEHLSLLHVMDTICVPSENCKHYVCRLLGNDEIINKINVLPHFLSFGNSVQNSFSHDSQNSQLSTNIVFLGALYQHKGGEIFLRCSDQIAAMGYQPYIWGHIQPALLNTFTNIPPVVHYRNWRELLELYKAYGAYIIVMPASCPETFSYTLYEALFLLRVPVVVGPYGNPAEVVRAYGVGEVMDSLTEKSLLDAVHMISENYDDYMSAITKYKRDAFHSFFKTPYIKKYTKDILGNSQQMPVALEQELPSNIDQLSHSGQKIMNKTFSNPQKSEIRILVVHALSENDPPYFFRVENPAYYMKKMGAGVDIVSLDDVPSSSQQYDLIYLSRTPYTEKLGILIKDAKHRRKTCVLDVDDLVFHSDFIDHFYFLNKKSSSFSVYKDLLANIERTFHLVDILLGSTPAIASIAQKHRKTSLYFRNMLRQSKLQMYNKIYEDRASFKEPIIGYFSGSDTHDKDFEMIQPILEQLFSTHPNVKLLVMGFVQSSSFFEKFSERIILQEFDSYDTYLRSLQRCKVVVIPNAEINEFTQCKSSIKFLEAAAVGTPVISSPIYEMLFSIDHGATSWIAKGKNDWVKYIEIALSGEHAEYIGENARKHVFERFSNKSETFFRLIASLV